MRNLYRAEYLNYWTMYIKIVDNYVVREMAKGYNATIIPPERTADHR